MSKIRLNIEVSQDLAKLLEELAESEDTTKAEIVRRALSVVKAFSIQREYGREHLGFTSDPTRLDAELLGILSAPSKRSEAENESKSSRSLG